MRRAALALLLIACSSRSPWSVVPGTPSARRIDVDRSIRVALGVAGPTLGATSDLTWYDGDGRTVLLRGRPSDEWRVESGTAMLRARGPNGELSPWRGQLVLRTDDRGFVTVGGRRYRGELVLTRGDTATIIVNRLRLEDYVRGVVAVEMGNRPRQDSAALQAQAVASRSYAYVRLGARGDFDVRATVLDQVYRGIDTENAGASAAVNATRGLVLRYQGRVVDALYSSTCGGSTAEPSEVWRTESAPYLQRVSDRIPNTNRFYCESAPRFRWTLAMSRPELDRALDRYLAAYASVPGGGPGTLRHLAIVRQTPSGRVAQLDIETARGAFVVRGDDIRSVLRTPGGEILYSTYFSVEPEYGRDGLIRRVTFRGRGNGHGVGMCQWGAIGRASSGQSFRQILGVYYPGTTIGPVSVQ